MEKRGLILSVLLILVAAMFASNFDSSITGRQVQPTASSTCHPTGTDEICIKKEINDPCELQFSLPQQGFGRCSWKESPPTHDCICAVEYNRPM